MEEEKVNLPGEEAAPQPEKEPAAPTEGQPAYAAPGVFAAPPEVMPFIPGMLTPALFAEKRGLKKAALLIGLSLTAMTVLSFVVGTVITVIGMLFGMEREQLAAFFNDPMVMQLLQIFLSVTLFLGPFLLIFKVGGQRISDLVPLGKPKKGVRMALFSFGLAFCAFANLAVSQMSEFFSRFGIEYHVDMPESPGGVWGFVLTFLATAVTPPLVEEFLCRGLILGSLRPYGDGFALVISSLMFGMMHGNFEQIPFAFLVGLALGFIVLESGSLWIAVAVHAANNAVSVLVDTFLDSFPVAVQNLIYGVYIAVCLLLGLAALVWSGKRSEGFRLAPAKTEATLKQKVKWYFSSPAVLIFMIICLLESLMYFQ